MTRPSRWILDRVFPRPLAALVMIAGCLLALSVGDGRETFAAPVPQDSDPGLQNADPIPQKQEAAAQDPARAPQTETDTAQTTKRDSAVAKAADNGGSAGTSDDEGDTTSEPAFSPNDLSPLADVELSVWTERLSSTRYAIRELAAQRLREADKKAIEPLVEAIDDGDLETIELATDILASLAARYPPDRDGGAYEYLNRFSKNGIGTVADRSTSAVIAIRTQRSLLAEKSVIDAGARIGVGTLLVKSSEGTPLYLMHLDDRFAKASDATQWFRWMDRVRNVLVTGESINPKILAGVASIPNLQKLVLADGKADLDSIRALRGLRGLENLEFQYVEMDDDLVDEIVALPIRESLSVIGSNISNAGGQRIRNGVAGLEYDFKRGGYLGVLCSTGVVNACLVTDVVAGSGADLAGIERGDKIIGVNDTPVSSFDDLKNAVSTFGIGQEIQVKIERDGLKMQFPMKLGRQIPAGQTRDPFRRN